MIKYFTAHLKSMFYSSKLNNKVRLIAFACASYCYHKYGKEVWVTSVFRENEETSVHGHWRGIDMDNDNLTIDQKIDVADYLNKMFVYDSERPEKLACLYHKVTGRGGDHWHLQCHRNTQLRQEVT